MTYAASEIINDLIIYITCIFGTDSTHLTDYYDFTKWTSIDFNLAEVRNAYEWLVENGYIYEYSCDRHSDTYFRNPYWNIGVTKKAWDWAKENTDLNNI